MASAPNFFGWDFEPDPNYPLQQELFDTFKAYLSPHSLIPPEMEARIFHYIVLENHPLNGGVEFSLTCFWTLAFLLAAQLDFDGIPMTRLIQLIKALTELAIKPNNVIGTLPPPESPEAWQNLAPMATALADRWDLIDVRGETMQEFDKPPNMAKAEYLKEQYKNWKNINGLMARLAGEGLYGAQSHAFTLLTMALEEDLPATDELRVPFLREVIRQHLPIAATYIMRCGYQLYDCVLGEFDCGRKGGRLWEGQEGYCFMRWKFWCWRFVQLTKFVFCPPDLSEMALVAATRMKAIHVEITGSE